ncbi:MAG TPA: hypothetical protein VL992_04070 [Tepidisphaeraceae bacterium]|nr:hypothetical protein [Tepidisphaeraceae bacterium]
MSTKTGFDVTEILENATTAFGDAIKAGAKAQEDIVKFWTNSFEGACPVSEFQKRGRQFVEEAVPAAQKQAQDWLKVVDANSRRAIDLLRRATDVEGDSISAGFTDAARKLWEESIDVIKENVQSLTQANVKMLEVWSDLLRKSLEEGVLKSAAPKAKQA